MGSSDNFPIKIFIFRPYRFMSVYTHLHQQDIKHLLSQYNIGQLVSFTGIEGGVENTNYFIDVEKDGQEQRYVLTLFEYLSVDALPFFIDLTNELAADNIPVPAPVKDQSGQALQLVRNKPAIIAPCLPGKHYNEISVDHCREMGQVLAQIHRSGQHSSLQQENQRGISWLDQQVTRLKPLLKAEDALIMSDQWRSINAELAKYTTLPAGLIHGDLFHDNVLFECDRITGVIDFYNACYDWLIYDVAVTVNDWCIKSDLSLDAKRCRALLDAYNDIRPFTEEERQAWSVILRLASFRFWVSRIITFIHPEEAVGSEHEQSQALNFKNPDEFRDILIYRTDHSSPPL